MTGAPLEHSMLARARAFHAQRPGLVALGAFAVGVLLGWWVLGWLVFPVTWTNARARDLAPGARQAYIQAVADSHAGNGDLVLARERLTELDAEVLVADLATLTGTGTDADARQHAAELAQALGLATTRPAATGSDATPLTGIAPAATYGDVTRTIAALALVAVAAAGLALAWAWWRWRRSSMTPAEPGAPAAGASVGRTEAVRGRGAPPWRPLRIDLGDTAIARYRADDERYYQTWLVHDERGSLIGGAGLQAHPVGSVNALDLWFFKREDESTEDSDTPIVTIVSQAAHADGVFRARLGNRRAVPAVAGEQCVLEAFDLALDVRIEAAEPAPESEQLGLTAVALTLTPHRRLAPDDAVEIEPPDPLLFRRD
jgi:hypothetical protein